MAFV
ncbi:hypothetical protein D030_1810A, partial [Vibrio parahaemolyticus AQ3810]